MKTALKFTTTKSLRMPVAISLIVASVVSLWFAAATPTAFGGANCPVCHKGVLDINTICASLDYRRHKDHGDKDGACPPTQSRAFLKPSKEPSHPKL